MGLLKKVIEKKGTKIAKKLLLPKETPTQPSTNATANIQNKIAGAGLSNIPGQTTPYNPDAMSDQSQSKISTDDLTEMNYGNYDPNAPITTLPSGETARDVWDPLTQSYKSVFTQPQREASITMAETARQEEVQSIIRRAKLAGMDKGTLSQAEQLGQFQSTYEGEVNPLSVGQALKEGAIEGGTLAAAGAAGGAIVGAAGAGVGAVPGAIIGGVGGGVGGFIKGVVKSFRQQTSENVAATYVDLPASNKNLRYIIADTNSGGDASGNLVAFQDQLDAVDLAYSHMKAISQKKPLGEDATVQMAKLEAFYAPGGARELLINEMQQAVYNPNPSKALMTYEQVMSELE